MNSDFSKLVVVAKFADKWVRSSLENPDLENIQVCVIDHVKSLYNVNDEDIKEIYVGNTSNIINASQHHNVFSVRGEKYTAGHSLLYKWIWDDADRLTDYNRDI